MKALHLTLKKKWFDMIASGEKKEEYREVKPYWENRLTYSDLVSRNNIAPMKVSYFYEVDQIYFKNGYSNDAPKITLECKGIEIREGNPIWGAEPGKKYFVIKLGEILKVDTPQ